MAGIFVFVLAQFIIVGAYLAYDITPSFLLRDANGIAEQPAYYGAISSVFCVFWMSAASICLFSAMLCRHRDGASRTVRSLVLIGLLTMALGMDDLLMLHEEMGPSAGIPETAFYLVYAVLGFVWFVFSLALIAQTNWLLLFAGIGGLAGSILFDTMVPHFTGQMMVEDSFKIFGIIFWTAYLLTFSWTALNGLDRRRSAPVSRRNG